MHAASLAGRMGLYEQPVATDRIGTMIDEIVRSYSLTLDYLRRMVADVPVEMFTRQVAGAVNHPAWVIGHLTYSCQAIGGEVGIVPWLPGNWQELFGTGSTPLDRPNVYPGKPDLLAALADGQSRVVRRLAELGEAVLGAPLPDERHRTMFPTIGDAVLHILTSHAAVHVGQVTVWRRVVGLGPLKESFI
jgi:hypothetical protein